MLRDDLGPIVRLGRVVMTQGVKESLSGEEVLNALLTHMRPQKPDAEHPSTPDKLKGCRVLKVYRSNSGRPFWIITEADGSFTTVLMPEEYSRNASPRNHSQLADLRPRFG